MMKVENWGGEANVAQRLVLPSDMDPEVDLILTLQADGDVVIKIRDRNNVESFKIRAEFCADGSRDPLIAHGLREFIKELVPRAEEVGRNEG